MSNADEAAEPRGEVLEARLLPREVPGQVLLRQRRRGVPRRGRAHRVRDLGEPRQSKKLFSTYCQTMSSAL